jgi:hypothetical protein
MLSIKKKVVLFNSTYISMCVCPHVYAHLCHVCASGEFNGALSVYNMLVFY